MATVVIAHDYTVKVFADTYGSPHVNVLKEGMLLTIMLERVPPVVFLCAKYGRPNERIKHEAVAIVEEHLNACWNAWRRIYV